jgi:protein SCO1/2
MGALRRLTLLVLFAAACVPVALQGTELAASPAPDFALTDALTIAELSLSSLRGRVVVLSFLYTHCPDSCPLTAERFREAQTMLGPEAMKVAFVAVSVDPLGDTPESVRAFTRDHRLAEGWHYLIGERTRLSGVWALYGIGVLDSATAQVPTTMRSL